MACSISAGLLKSCEYSVAGVSNIYLGDYSKFTFTKTSGGTITGITATPSASTFFEFEATIDTSSFSSELQVANGRKYFNQTLSFSNDSNSQEAKTAFENIGLAKIVAIVKTKGGAYNVLGIDGGLEATALSFASGAAAGDAAGWSVTLTGVGKEVPSIMASTVTVPV